MSKRNPYSNKTNLFKKSKDKSLNTSKNSVYGSKKSKMFTKSKNNIYK